jgi:hypothetical protein
MHTKHKPKKLTFHSTEKWVSIRGYKGADGQRYAISNFGRAIAYWEDFNFGYFLRYSYIGKYPGVNLRKNGKGKAFFIHRLVAEHFCNRPSTANKYVIHLDYKKENNYYKNLKWATRETWGAHMLEDPNYKKTRAEFTGRGHKLTTERVKMIKRKLKDGKTRMKIIAKQFGISEMQLYRIKVGINWAHVK